MLKQGAHTTKFLKSNMNNKKMWLSHSLQVNIENMFFNLEEMRGSKIFGVHFVKSNQVKKALTRSPKN